MFGKLTKVTKPEERTKRSIEARDIRGPQAYEYGVIGKRPGDNWKAMQMLYEQRKNDSLSKRKDEGLKQRLEAEVRHKFELITDKKSLLNQLKLKVVSGLETAERDLHIRRQRLRCMLLDEEANLTREYVDKCQRVTEKKLEDMKEKVRDIHNRRETERKQLVHEKRIQQYLERCEDLRTVRSQMDSKLVKKAQEYQMKERELLKEQEREEERMWTAVAKKEYEAKVAREIEDARQKFKRDRELAEILLLQKRSVEENINTEIQKVKNEEAKMIQKLEEDLKQEKIAEFERKLKKKEEVYRDLQEQIHTRERFLNQLAKEEHVLDQTFSKVARAEYERELSARQDYREQLRREYQLYRDNLAELRKMEAAQEDELEKILQEEKAKVDAERKEKAMKLKAAREKLKNDVLRERKKQVERRIEEAEKLKKAEEEEVKLSRELREMNDRLEREHNEQIRLLRLKYAKDLQDQMEYTSALKERERQEIEREWKAGLLEEECYRRLIKELMGRHLDLEPHPFYKVLQSVESSVSQATDENVSKR